MSAVIKKPGMRKVTVILLLNLFLSACEVKNDQKALNSGITPKEKIIQKSNPNQKVDSAKSFLYPGCIVLRRGNDVISSMFAQLNKSDASFSHCGIAFREQNQWMVYHSIGGEDNPDEKLRREPFESFVGQDHNFGFGICAYPLKETEVESLHQLMKNWHGLGIPFDMKFDLSTNDRLYCAEMLYKAFNQVTNRDDCFETTLHQGFRYVSTDNLFTNKASKMLCRINY
jgi:hypothetical protein